MSLRLALDHLVVAAPTLGAGVAWVEDRLGVAMAGGGAHPGVATHNRLLGLGDCYLEVLARNPAERPVRKRWFGLDDQEWSPDAATEPRLITWVLRASDIDAALRLPGACGVAREASRGALKWRLSVPDDGALPMDGAFPTFIHWPDGVGPAGTLPQAASLASLAIVHPRANEISAALDGALDDPRVTFQTGPLAVQADITTSDGMRHLRRR